MTSAKTSKVSYDLNSTLRVANILICVITAYLYNTTGSTDYVNELTIFLLCLFAIENICMLLYEKRRRNPFILLLVLVVTVFYMMRIPSLIWMPLSASTLQIMSITTLDLNYALIFILFANASMFLGFYLGNKHNVHHLHLSFSDDTIPSVKNSILILILYILVTFASSTNPAIWGRLYLFTTILLMNQNLICLLYTSDAADE